MRRAVEIPVFWPRGTRVVCCLQRNCRPGILIVFYPWHAREFPKFNFARDGGGRTTRKRRREQTSSVIYPFGYGCLSRKSFSRLKSTGYRVLQDLIKNARAVLFTTGGSDVHHTPPIYLLVFVRNQPKLVVKRGN